MNGVYLPFDRPVPFSVGGEYAEAPLRAINDPSRVGAYLQGKSVRRLDEADFAALVRRGLSETLAPANALKLELDRMHTDETTQFLLQAPIDEQERRVEQILMNRKIRDAIAPHFRWPSIGTSSGRRHSEQAGTRRPS